MMNTSILIFLMAVVIGVVLFSLGVMFVEEDPHNEMAETAFECGFEPFYMPRVPFSVHFFTVTIVFLIFDLEVVILMPVLFKLYNFSHLVLLTIMVWVLLLGLFVEWFDSSVSWQL